MCSRYANHAIHNLQIPFSLNPLPIQDICQFVIGLSGLRHRVGWTDCQISDASLWAPEYGSRPRTRIYEVPCSIELRNERFITIVSVTQSILNIVGGIANY